MIDSALARWHRSPTSLRLVVSAFVAFVGLGWFSLTGLLLLSLVGLASVKGRGDRWPGQGWWNQGRVQTPLNRGPESRSSRTA
jgi:hypothetical protein